MSVFEPTPINTPRIEAVDESTVPSSATSTRPSTSVGDGPGTPLLFRPETPQPQQGQPSHESQPSNGFTAQESYSVVEPDTSHLQLAKPRESDIQEMCGMLKASNVLCLFGFHMACMHHA